MDTDTETDDVRKQLKVKILQLRADGIQVKISSVMDTIETMTQEYTTIMQEMYELNGVDNDQSRKHIEMLSRMVEKSPVNYDACNTSDDMLHLMMKEFEQVKELEKKETLPDVGDNSEIWDRIAKAQQTAEQSVPSTPNSPPTAEQSFTSMSSPLLVSSDGSDEPASPCSISVSDFGDIDSDESESTSML
jgi:hypothetical protein